MVHCHTVHLPLGALLSPCAMCGAGADPKAMHLHLAAVHERSGDAALADETYERLAKKWRSHADVWIAWISAMMGRAEQPLAKETLQRAVDALPRSRHVEVLSRPHPWCTATPCTFPSVHC